MTTSFSIFNKESAVDKQLSSGLTEEGSHLSRTDNAFHTASIEHELRNISQWWQKNAIDEDFEGFVGEIDFYGNQVVNANKGIILNSRILWFFSELAYFKGVESDEGRKALDTAKRSYDYIIKYFNDTEFGGSYWEVDSKGNKTDGKKQVYAQCFCIYAFSAYYKATQDQTALDKALSYFELVERYARDFKFGGYLEALTETWQSIDDFRLSDKDMNVPKSMNTHLHVLEAYAALYHVHPTKKTEEALRHVLAMFEENIIDRNNGHLKLFFDMTWQDLSTAFSYGHDIEASWLIWEAVEYLGDEALSKSWRPIIINMAQVCLTESIGEKGQVCEDFDKTTRHRAGASYWWVQAEALVGYLNAYQLTDDKQLREVCDDIWQFIVQYHLDTKNGEWHWLSSNDVFEQQRLEYKVGFWKGPYHNGRAMMEVLKLFHKMEEV